MNDDRPWWEDKDAFLAAVTTATKAATQDVARKNRYRLVLSGIFAGLAVGALLSFFVARAVSAHNSNVNCVLITELAGLGVHRINVDEHPKLQKHRAQIATFEHESRDRLGLSQKAFDKLVTEGNREVEAEEHEQGYRQKVLGRIARHNCG